MRTNKWKVQSLAVTAGLLVAIAANLVNADDSSPAGMARVSDFSSTSRVKQTAATLQATQAGLSIFSSGCASKDGCASKNGCASKTGCASKDGCASVASSCCETKSSSCGSCAQSGCHSCNGHWGHGTLCTKSPIGHCQKGCCGKGCPPSKHYYLLYAANPDYFDQRDGKVFSAQGYGIPMAVPLAPNVEHTYNYGWGIPSSRLTPVSRIQPRTWSLR